jgi:endonuclease/exonuclease/phosphatase family metal-dependent hydrolase
MTDQSVDVFCLNECSPSLARQVFEKSECCGYTYAVAEFAGNALFSRFPIIDSTALITTPSTAIEARSAAVASILVEVRAPDSTDTASLSVELTVMGMHLSHIEESDRLAEFKELTGEVSWATLYLQFKL